MADLDRNLKASSASRIVGSDEQFSADVIQEFGINKLRVKSDTNINSDLLIVTQFNVNLPISDTSWTTIFTKSAPTNISGLIANFNKDRVFVRLLVDGNEIFNARLIDLRSLVDLQSYVVPEGIYLKYKSDVRNFFYVPRFPQTASTGITFQAKAEAGNTDITYVSGIFQVS